jgi:dihydrofolate reductase
MKLVIVVAIAEDGAIGKNGTLPWRIPADLQHFKKVTMDKPVIMGRKTWAELKGQPLKGRYNIILSRTLSEVPPGVHLSDNLADAIVAAETDGFQEAAIIGGSGLFHEAIPMAATLFITRVHTTVPDADTHFPEIDMTQWKLVREEAHEADEKNQHAYTFQRWERA